MEVFDAGFFARPQAAVGSHDGRPLFVVGMPRSGTTLTERIIAMHSRAHGCGELPDLQLIVKTLGARWPDIARDLEPGDRKSVVSGKRWSVRVGPGGRRSIKKKKIHKE